jgi:hypothetical protein
MRQRINSSGPDGATVAKNAAAAIGAGLGMLLLFLFMLVHWGNAMTAGGIVGFGLICGALTVPVVFILLMCAEPNSRGMK